MRNARYESRAFALWRARRFIRAEMYGALPPSAFNDDNGTIYTPRLYASVFAEYQRRRI